MLTLAFTQKESEREGEKDAVTGKGEETSVCRYNLLFDNTAVICLEIVLAIYLSVCLSLHFKTMVCSLLILWLYA